MTRSLLSIIFSCLSFQLFAQSREVLIIRRKLDRVNDSITNFVPIDKRGMIVTNPAVNKLLADKVASYLSEEGDLSLYKNYAILNSSDGSLTISHNFPIKYNSGLIKWIHTVGAKVNALDGFAAVFTDKKFSSEMSLSYKLTLFDRGNIKFDGLVQPERLVPLPPAGVKTQKLVMDAQRTLIVNRLKLEMTQKSDDFEAALANAIAKDKQIDAQKADIRAEFYKALELEYNEKFTEQQVDALQTTESYNSLRKSWTSLSVSIPLTTKSYKVGQTFLTDFGDKELYPWEISVTKTWIRESQAGKLFFSFGGFIYQNNNIMTEDLTKIDVRKLVSRPDTSMAEVKTDEVYIGDYRSFVTPKLRGQIVVFPKDWNIGVSAVIEKHFGAYDPLNARLGVPIRLNDKDGKPTVNFEIQGRMTDLDNQIKPDDSFWKKASIGLSVGLPFTTIIK